MTAAGVMDATTDAATDAAPTMAQRASLRSAAFSLRACAKFMTASGVVARVSSAEVASSTNAPTATAPSSTTATRAEPPPSLPAPGAAEVREGASALGVTGAGATDPAGCELEQPIRMGSGSQNNNNTKIEIDVGMVALRQPLAVRRA